MKRLTGFLSVWFAVVFSLLFAVACGGTDDSSSSSSSSASGVKADPTQFVKIVASSQKADLANMTLEGYMDVLVGEGELDYTSSNGMIVSVNGTANDDSTWTYWMIYSNDADYTTSAYYIEYEGTRYDQTLLGFSTLPVQDGCTYVLAYHGF